MRVVSLVPSWTETLLEAGVNVVGRTRFCIHPQPAVRAIPAVGGTKDWNFAAVKALKPDLLILDKEENPKFMAEQHEVPYFATHVDGVSAVAGELRSMAKAVGKERLIELAREWDDIAKWPGLEPWSDFSDIPGVIEWGRKPSTQVRTVLYVIWKNPWMVISADTFIGSVLEKCGLSAYLPRFSTKYPEIEFKDFVPEETLLLFSSEPYPFLKKREELFSLSNPYAFVDGESFSWFGVRCLRFLQQQKMRGM